jgi:hypothetical protein
LNLIFLHHFSLFYNNISVYHFYLKLLDFLKTTLIFIFSIIQFPLNKEKSYIYLSNMNYKSYFPFLIGLIMVFSVLLSVNDSWAFHTKQTKNINQEINSIALEVSKYLNESATILKSNKADISQALVNINLAQDRLSQLEGWHSNSTIAQMINQIGITSAQLQGGNAISSGGFSGGSSIGSSSPSSFSTSSNLAPPSSSPPAASGGFISDQGSSGPLPSGSFEGTANGGLPLEGSSNIGSTSGSSSSTPSASGASSSSTSSSSSSGAGNTETDNGGASNNAGSNPASGATSSGSFADLSNPGEFSSFQDPIPQQPGQPLHPTLPPTPALPPEPAEPLAPVIPPPSSE